MTPIQSATRVFLAIVIVLVFALVLSSFKLGARLVWGILAVSTFAVLLRNEPQFNAALGFVQSQFNPPGAQPGHGGSHLQ